MCIAITSEKSARYKIVKIKTRKGDKEKDKSIFNNN
jgi:hypothetical protein